MKPKVYVAVPSRTRNPGCQTMDAINRAASVFDELPQVWVCGFSVCYSRNQAVYDFLSREEYTHFMSFDADCIPPPDTIERLLEVDAGVVTGCVPQVIKGNLCITVAAELHGNRPSFYAGWFDGVVDTPCCGAACLLVERQVLEDVGFPWFRWGQDHDFFYKSQGEDIWFCRRVQEEGHGPIKAHGDVRCGHLKETDLKNLVWHSQLLQIGNDAVTDFLEKQRGHG